jgi:REP element-mobilizing transposase RayT
MTFFLITTDHLADRIWFRDDEDFKTGMNYAATVACLVGVHVLAFILMSNHVHFVLECSEEKALAFITEYKRLYSRYLSQKYGTVEYLRRNGVDIQPLMLGDESLERAVAYVQMNCVAANICLSPADYPWGTGRCFFNPAPCKGQPINALSVRERRRVLHSKMEPPEIWKVEESGYVLPESYVNVDFVEKLFRTPKRMNYFLLSSSKARRRLALKEEGLPSFRDQVILAAVQDLCQTLFHQRTVDALTEEQRSELVSQIRRRFSADLNQIARVTGISLRDVIRMLERF